MIKYILIIAGLFIIPFSSNAFFNEDFEDCSLGDLSDCYLWFTSGSSTQIVDTITHSGIRSVRVGEIGPSSNYRSAETGKATGTIAFWFYGEYLNDDPLPVKLYFGSDSSHNEIILTFTFDIETNRGYVLGSRPNPQSEFNFGYFSLYEWNFAIIEYDGGADQCRMSINNAEWSEWVDSYQVFSTLKTIKIYDPYSDITYPDRIGIYFFDDFEDDPDYEPLPVLELEDCGSASSTADRILCELKNSFQGLFYPTSDKINQLKDTLGNFQDKFPFNYISEINSFFQNISDNLNNSEEISIGIFGSATSSLNFGPLNSTSTPYGESNLSVLDYLKIFFKMLCFLIFGFWLFNYVKRIFK